MGFSMSLSRFSSVRRSVEDDVSAQILSQPEDIHFTSDEMETFMCIRSEVVSQNSNSYGAYRIERIYSKI